ncbi:MAG: hypothetical protein ABR540_06795 [Acidimicrobiales bacterium]
MAGPEERDEDEEAARFVEGLIARGEAAEPDANGELPEGATHEIVTDAAGVRRVRRRRFWSA